MGEITSSITRDRNGLDLSDMPIEELLSNIRDVPRHARKPLQRFEGDAAGYLRGTVEHREIDGASYAIGDGDQAMGRHAHTPYFGSRNVDGRN